MPAEEILYRRWRTSVNHWRRMLVNEKIPIHRVQRKMDVMLRRKREWLDAMGWKEMTRFEESALEYDDMIMEYR